MNTLNKDVEPITIGSPVSMDDARYLAACEQTGLAVTRLLDLIMDQINQETGSTDCGPVSQGALVGLLRFFVSDHITDDEVRQFLSRMADHHLPQLRVAIAERQMEAGEGGRA